MNILYWLRQFPKTSNTFIINELLELERRGHNVYIFALKSSPSTSPHPEVAELNADIRYGDLPVPTDVTELLSKKVFHPRVLRNALFTANPKWHAISLLLGKQCIEFTQSLGNDIDIIHTHFAERSRFPAKYAASYLDIPFTVTAHAFDIFQNPNNTFLRCLFSRTNRIITISDYNRAHIDQLIDGTTPVDVVHAGIDPKKFTPSSKSVENRVLTVARLVEKKGIVDAIRGMEMVIGQLPDVEYHIVGSGPLKHQIEKVVTQRGLEENIDLLGRISDQRLIREYDLAQCFLLPCVVAKSGDRDGIPVALMEAMAMETPPVSTNISGIPELIDDGVNGILVEPSNAAAISDAVSEILTDDSRREHFSKRGRETVISDFNISVEVEQLESVFEYTVTNYE